MSRGLAVSSRRPFLPFSIFIKSIEVDLAELGEIFVQLLEIGGTVELGIEIGKGGRTVTRLVVNWLG